ncbi:MAG: ATP-binding protein [Planctomycetes bacterium]|nr:ATP-binding protein [Planctomycetota bacterium]
MLVNGVTRIDLPSYQGGPALGPEAGCGIALPCFVAGPENRLAVPVLQRLLSDEARGEAAQTFNPLVLIGPTGSGKSHLARGIFRRLHDLHGSESGEYFTAIDFAREVRAAHAEGALENFRDRLASLSLLVIEDLQRLPERVFIQRELRDTLDTLIDAGCTVVLTAQGSPAAMAPLEAGLRDRIASGLTIRLSTPGTEARHEILQLAAEDRNLSISPKQLQSLVQRIEGPASQLLRALSEWELSGSTDDETATFREPVKLKQIIAIVARYFSLTQAALRSSARRKSLVHARGIAIYLARRLTDLSYAQIGQGLGHRDHTTIMHAQRNMQRLLANDAATQQAVDELQRILTAV